MKPCSKPVVMALSITQIVMSAAFFLLGMIHGLYGERSATLTRFFPCWIVALVLPVGIMGLALRSPQTLRSLQLLKHAIWSLCVVCIVCSTLILYIYTDWWVVNLQVWAFYRNAGFKPHIVDGYFLAKGVEMVYTQEEKTTLVFCTFGIICSVIEIVLAAAMMKICKTTKTTPQLSSSSRGYYQMGECQQPLLVYPVGQQQVHVDVRDNQCRQRPLETSI
ncbi:PREDICTED: uncharacterized protein LOC107342470 isoform X1 [Acropora digitifera]|uniref:uncharacterized protein LOC107342470 isoform X1 n=1 Tax=Acropora digitifera TaxID=70779 RepID=UPI00077A0E82|nr:PREDICTED: uncharacterized protein LOC107342470 isoform X1 [Acropora digitifera]